MALGSCAGDYPEEPGSSAINGQIVRVALDGEAHERGKAEKEAYPRLRQLENDPLYLSEACNLSFFTVKEK